MEIDPQAPYHIAHKKCNCIFIASDSANFRFRLLLLLLIFKSTVYPGYPPS